jgi:hypothetical protein
MSSLYHACAWYLLPERWPRVRLPTDLMSYSLRCNSPVYPGTWHPTSDVEVVVNAIQGRWSTDELRTMNENRAHILVAKPQLADIIPASLQNSRAAYQENVMTEAIFLKWITQSQWVRREKDRRNQKDREHVYAH